MFAALKGFGQSASKRADIDIVHAGVKASEGDRQSYHVLVLDAVFENGLFIVVQKEVCDDGVGPEACLLVVRQLITKGAGSHFKSLRAQLLRRFDGVIKQL